MQEIADKLRRKASTIRGYCASGRIPQAYRLNNREWRITEVGLMEFQEQSREGGKKVDLGAWRKKGEK